MRENWKWQDENSIKDVSQFIGKNTDFHFNMKITPYYASLFKDKGPDDPIRLQAVPDIREESPIDYGYYEKYNITVGDSLGERLNKISFKVNEDNLDEADIILES